MPTRIAHLSDLHCPAKTPGQAEALAASVNAAKPDLLIVTGDLTRRGRNREYRAALELLSAMPARRLVVPGNHDVPVADTFARPFARFAEYLAGQPLFIETEDVLVVGLNTVAAFRFGDWSLGTAPRARLEPVEALLKQKPAGKLGIVAAHHPLRPHALDPQRSATSHGPEAFKSLAAAGMSLLLHGHLHRTSKTCLAAAGSSVCELCANTALSDRERAGAAGYNLIDVTGPAFTVTPMSWTGTAYEAGQVL
ncbi:3',5'-cyclic AMP phosphodiesterase CpdA [Rhizomicrobium palustre]|uniref:3',5'-cyclic AMP phosphodiesterase CpdA n=1 Tax=Rhizomicrobium palustre TaxID=189966 RepID=A0A846MWA2_9PROT|nr:metallophosphoesterase [Rhizomicrobium palustre]NIK87267.1 3',5'-cyclic AMP phosphodiesterase CpdA [Rhizomicrobium palustre]